MKITRWFIVCVAVGALGVVAAATVSGATGGLPAGSRSEPSDVTALRAWLAERQARQAPAFNAAAKAAMATARRSPVPSSAGAARPLGGQQGGFEQVVDDFEGSVIDTQKWFWIIDSDLPTPDKYGEYLWALSQCTSKPRKPGDVQSFWAIGGGKDGRNKKCGDLYPNGAASEAALFLDLRFWDPTQTQQLELQYDIWLNTRLQNSPGTNVVPDGLFLVLCIPEGGEPCRRQAVLEGQNGQSLNWFDKPTIIDLMNACDKYDRSKCYSLIGREVIVKFVFKSERPTTGMDLPETFPGGAFIDNVRLVSDREPGPVLEPPLPTWTVPPVNTFVVPTAGTPTATPTYVEETATPGPSETPIPDETETPTPDVTAGPPSETPMPSDTPDMMDPTDTPTPRPTATRTRTATAAPAPPKAFLPIGYRNQ